VILRVTGNLCPRRTWRWKALWISCRPSWAEKASPPVCTIEDLTKAAKLVNKDFNPADAPAALGQLNSWGRIVYQPNIVQSVIVSPTFLTQQAMGELFKPTNKQHANGRLSRKNLDLIWSSPAVAPFRDDLLRLMERFDVCYAQTGPQGGEEFVFTSLLSEKPAAEFSEMWPQKAREGMVELCRVFSLDVVPSHLVSRVLSRLHKKIHQQMVWRHGALFEEARTTLGTLQLIRDSTSPGGRLVIRVRPLVDKRHAGSNLLNTIVVVVKACISLYPGIVTTELLECIATGCTCLTPVADVVSSISEKAILCRRKFPVSPRRLLEHAGLVDAAAEDTHIGSLRMNNDLVKAIMARLDTHEGRLGAHDMALRVIVQQIEGCNYPGLFVLLPAESPSTWLGKVTDRAQRVLLKKFQLLPLCEFSLPNEALCHPPKNVEGKEIVDIKHKELVQRLGTALKVTSGLLKAVQVAVKIAGIPLPDIASLLDTIVDVASETSSAVDKLQVVYDYISQQSKNTDVDVKRTIERPQRLEGKALGDVEELFGRNLVLQTYFFLPFLTHFL